MKAWLVWLTATIFWIGETWYFGWNLHPQSRAERGCDFVASILFVAAFILWINKRVIIVFIGDSKTTVTGIGRGEQP